MIFSENYRLLFDHKFKKRCCTFGFPMSTQVCFFCVLKLRGLELLRRENKPAKIWCSRSAAVFTPKPELSGHIEWEFVGSRQMLLRINITCADRESSLKIENASNICGVLM